MSLPPIERLQTLANEDAWLVQRGRYIDVTFLMDVGATPYLVTIHKGRVEKLERGPFVLPRWTFALRAPDEAWAKFWEAMPPPGFHDLIAMLKFRALRIEGDQHPFMANLRYFKDLLALLRAPAGGAR